MSFVITLSLLFWQPVKFYWHLLKGNFFLALASCLSFFGQIFLALVFRPYFQLFLSVGSF